MPCISLEQFNAIIELIPEPYATMVYVAAWTGLRVSELIGLGWEDINADRNSIRIDQRFCRGIEGKVVRNFRGALNRVERSHKDVQSHPQRVDKQMPLALLRERVEVDFCYSQRRVTIGSKLIALRVGIYAATSPSRIMTTPPNTIETGLFAGNP